MHRFRMGMQSRRLSERLRYKEEALGFSIKTTQSTQCSVLQDQKLQQQRNVRRLKSLRHSRWSPSSVQHRADRSSSQARHPEKREVSVSGEGVRLQRRKITPSSRCSVTISEYNFMVKYALTQAHSISKMLGLFLVAVGNWDERRRKINPSSTSLLGDINSSISAAWIECTNSACRSQSRASR